MEFVNPQKVVENYFALQPGMRVADFGAGSGHYTLAAAGFVGSKGIVYAIDIQKDLLDRIKKHAEELGMENVEIVWADLEKPEGSGLAENSIDFVIASNILFQIENKNAFIDEIIRVLKNGGRIGVVDWKDSFGGLGPREEDVLRPDECRALFLQKGLILENEFEPGGHHYGFIFKKP